MSIFEYGLNNYKFILSVKSIRKRNVGDVLPEKTNCVFKKSIFEYGLIIIISPYSKILN